MAEKTLYEAGNVSGKGEILLTDQRVILRQEPVVKYENDVKEIPLSKIANVGVVEMDFSASFVLNWLGIEMALLLVFFGLTSASLPMYHMYQIMMGAPGDNPLGQAGKLLISAVMVASGLILIPQFDAVLLKITSKEGKTIRYLKNIDYRPSVEKFKLLLLDRISRTRKK
jgi:hypothetical protein